MRFPSTPRLPLGGRATIDVQQRVGKSLRTLPSDILGVAKRKLDLVNAAHSISDLAVPPGNRLERLKGKLKDLHSIRINDQWRIVFRWIQGNAHDVSIQDYH